MNHEIELSNLESFITQFNIILSYSKSEKQTSYKCDWIVTEPRLTMDYSNGKPDYLILTVKLMVLVGPTPVYVTERSERIPPEEKLPPHRRYEIARQLSTLVMHEMALAGLMHNFKIIEDRDEY